MLNYEKLYRILFNGITDALDIFEKEGYSSAKNTLIKAQQAAEDYYIEAEEEDAPVSPSCPVYILPHDAHSNEKPHKKPFSP